MPCGFPMPISLFPIFRIFQEVDQVLDQEDEQKNNEENREPVEQTAYMTE